MAKKGKKPRISKTIALIFIILMLASTIGMFASIILKPSEKIQIPGNRIIHYKLTEAQVKELIKNYYTVIEYEYPSTCLECGSLLNSLETWTRSSDNQIYLQEIEKDSGSSKLIITSLRGQKILYDPTQEDARDDICEILITRSLFCIEI